MTDQFAVWHTYDPIFQPSHETNRMLISTANQITLSGDIRRYAMKEMTLNVGTAQMLVSQALISTHSLLTQTPQVGRSKDIVEALLLDFGQRMIEVTDQANAEIVRLSGTVNTPYPRVKGALYDK